MHAAGDHAIAPSEGARRPEAHGHAIVQDVLEGDRDATGDVAPLLAAQGYRVVVPYLRGYGATRFLSDATPRNGQQSVIATDIIALMDALGIRRAAIGGCDVGGPARGHTAAP